MLRSMTGYGRVQRVIGGYRVLLEIRSVNHRFFDFSARVPRLYGYVEGRLRAAASRAVSRGKVEAVLVLEPAEDESAAVQVNLRLAEGYVSALRALQNHFGLRDDLSAGLVARLPDVLTVQKAQDNENAACAAVETAAEEAFAGLTHMRETEGARLRDDLLARGGTVRALLSQVEERSPQTVEEYRARLLARMKEALSGAAVDENRLLLEAAVFADKVSVTEETVRLRSHLAQYDALLTGGGPVGRKLDFLMQEMNREANTIGSKAADARIAGLVVDLKAELEKMREQIQNIE